MCRAWSVSYSEVVKEMDLLDKLTLEDLDEEQQQLAELIGFNNYIKLVRVYGGTDIRILQAETLIKDKRDEEIRSLYNGKNLLELSQKYHLCDRTLRAIIGTKRNLPGQVKLF